MMAPNRDQAETITNMGTVFYSHQSVSHPVSHHSIPKRNLNSEKLNHWLKITKSVCGKGQDQTQSPTSCAHTPPTPSMVTFAFNRPQNA